MVWAELCSGTGPCLLRRVAVSVCSKLHPPPGLEQARRVMSLQGEQWQACLAPCHVRSVGVGRHRTVADSLSKGALMWPVLLRGRGRGSRGRILRLLLHNTGKIAKNGLTRWGSINQYLKKSAGAGEKPMVFSWNLKQRLSCTGRSSFLREGRNGSCALERQCQPGWEAHHFAEPSLIKYRSRAQGHGLSLGPRATASVIEIFSLNSEDTGRCTLAA